MPENKLSSEQMPEKFMEWLLAIGCPAEKVPSLDKVTEMCRGQYYMVWRSLMEHAEPKSTLRQKRLQVFCDDMIKWKRKNVFNKVDNNVVIPDKLALWHQHNDLKEKVTAAEMTIEKAQLDLQQLIDKLSTKLSHRNLSRKRVQDMQRRAWLLQQVIDDLKRKKENLEETRNIANSLCLPNGDVDVQSKLDKYITLLRRHNQSVVSSSLLAANSVDSFSVASTNGDANLSDVEDQLSWVTKCRGDNLWPQLSERRAALVTALTRNATLNKSAEHVGDSNPKTVLAHTAALHCSLALEALKQRSHLKQARKRLEAAISTLNNYLTGEACELLVLKCERARATARASALRGLLAEVTSRGGIFGAGADLGAEESRVSGRQIAAIDKNIESKREELKRLVTSLATTEKKLQNVRECLLTIFSGLQKNMPLYEQDKYRGQVDFPQESIATLRQFYEEKREARRGRLQLSLSLDVSDGDCYNDTIENTNLKFADELKTYLKIFSLEKNRKLVLESGEKIWIFETVQAAVERLHLKWQNADLPCSLVCPSVGLACSLNTVTDMIRNKAVLEAILGELRNEVLTRNVNIDLTLRSKEEEAKDKIKRRLSENIVSLQKINKTLDLGRENLTFWSDNSIKKFMSTRRFVNGMSYQDCEALYMENLSLNM